MQYENISPESCLINDKFPEMARVPSAMQARDRWVFWLLEPDASGRPTKVPYQARGHKASTTNPGTWTSWKHAQRDAHLFAGVGFVFGNGVAGIDLDHVRHPETGAIIAWAARVIAQLDTYTELSPSRSGFHLFFRGSKPPGRCNLRYDDGTAFEIYDRGRFFTVTGQHVRGTPRELREIPLVELEHVCAEMTARLPARPPAPVPLTTATAPITLDDQDVLRRMFASRNGDMLARLYHGEHNFGSASDGDMRLAGALAFWCGRDAAQMDRLFRASGLMRPKWLELRGESTYGAQTIARACANCSVTFGGAAIRG